MKRNLILRTVISTLLCLMMVTSTLADVLILPSGTKVIEEYAFYGDTSIDEVVLPEGIEEIGDYAFAESGLTKINLPSTLEEGSIADNAIDKDKGVEVTATYGTDAYDWAVDNGFIADANAENFNYRSYGDGTCAVTGYKGTPSGDLRIPSRSPDGDIVTTIGTYAFRDCVGFTGRLMIPDSVTTIGDRAFQNCSGLTGKLTIPASVTAINAYAFYDCGGFTGNLTIPNSVTTIGYSAFYGCSGFTGDLTIPDSVTAINGYAFYYCSGFTGNLTIPDCVTTIGDYAFGLCSGLTGELIIPDGITIIGDYVFYYCSGLTGELKIPDSVTTIGNSAFSNCGGLTGELTIPDSVTTIGISAFINCSGLTGELIIPDSVTTIGAWAFGNCTGLTGRLMIPDSVTIIENSAFYNCSGLTGELTIPDSVTTIENSAFYNCSGLTGRLTIPDSVTTIKDSAFYNCSGLTGGLTIPDSVTTIGNKAFYNCFGLKGNLIIPDRVTTIGRYAFDSCSGFDGRLILSDNLENLGYDAFSGCSGFSGELIIPNSLKAIPSNAFKNCSGFTGNLVIPKGVTFIGNDAFSGCTGFDGSLVIPDSVTEIGNAAFQNCTGFTGVLSIPSRLTEIKASTFDHCSGLTGQLIIPDHVVSIGQYAFRDCRSLTGDLSIPDSVQDIASYAFLECSGLSGCLYLGEGLKWVGTSPFGNYPSQIPFTDIFISSENAYFSGYANQYQPFNQTALEHIYVTGNSGTWQRLIELGYSSWLTEWNVPRVTEVSFESTEIEVGTPLVFALKTVNTSKVALCFEKEVYEVYNVDEAGTVQASRVIHDAKNGTREVSFRPFKGSASGKETDSYPITVTSHGRLEAPEITDWQNDFIIGSGNIVLSWKSVDHATGYALYLIYPNGHITTLNLEDSDQPAVLDNGVYTYAIPGELINSVGEWSLRLMAYGPGYSQSSSVCKIKAEFAAGENTIKLSGYIQSADGQPLAGALIAFSENGYPFSSGYSDRNGYWELSGFEKNKVYSACFSFSVLTSGVMEVETGETDMLLDPVTLSLGDMSYVSSDTIVIRAEIVGDGYSLNVFASDRWKASTDVSWIHFDRTQGYGNSELTVTVDTNEGRIRTASIVLSADDISFTIPVIQLSGIMNRIGSPTITNLENDATLEYGPVELEWTEVESAGYYVISLRDREEDRLILNHSVRATAEKLSCILTPEYFVPGREYRVAVGAVPEGLLSTDSLVGWCERIFTVSEQPVDEVTWLHGRVIRDDGEGNISVVPGSTVTLYKVLDDEGNTVQVQDPVLSEDDGTWVFMNLEPDMDYVVIISPPVSAGTRMIASTQPLRGSGSRGTVSSATVNVSVSRGENNVGDVKLVNQSGTDGKYPGLWAVFYQYTDKDNAFTDENLRYVEEVSNIDFTWEDDNQSMQEDCRFLQMKVRTCDDKKLRKNDRVWFTNRDKFAARFVGVITIPYQQAKLRITGDDGIRLEIGGVRYVDKWSETFGGMNVREFEISGGTYDFDLQYYNSTGKSYLKLEFSFQQGDGSWSNWSILPDVRFKHNEIYLYPTLNFWNFKGKSEELDQKLNNYVDGKLSSIISDLVTGMVIPGFSDALGISNKYEALTNSQQGKWADLLSAFGMKAYKTIGDKCASAIGDTIGIALTGKDDFLTKRDKIEEEIMKQAGFQKDPTTGQYNWTTPYEYLKEIEWTDAVTGTAEFMTWLDKFCADEGIKNSLTRKLSVAVWDVVDPWTGEIPEENTSLEERAAGFVGQYSFAKATVDLFKNTFESMADVQDTDRMRAYIYLTAWMNQQPWVVNKWDPFGTPYVLAVSDLEFVRQVTTLGKATKEYQHWSDWTDPSKFSEGAGNLKGIIEQMPYYSNEALKAIWSNQIGAKYGTKGEIVVYKQLLLDIMDYYFDYVKPY